MSNSYFDFDSIFYCILNKFEALACCVLVIRSTILGTIIFILYYSYRSKVTGVAAAGTSVAGGFALGSLLTRILPPLALEKLAPDDDANAVEDLLGSFLKAQGHYN